MNSRNRDNSGKLTWEMIFEDFKKRQPLIASERMTHWCSYGWMTILVYLKGHEVLIYNYDSKTAHYLTPDEIKKLPYSHKPKWAREEQNIE